MNAETLDNLMRDPATNLGCVYVQMPDQKVPAESLFAIEHPRLGIMLMDRDGKCVNPKSQRLGGHGRSKSDPTAMLVCDDDVSAETRQRLVAAGYSNVVERP